MTSDLAAFLRVRLDEDAARQVDHGGPGLPGWHTVNCGWSLGEFSDHECDCGVPQRVLADVASKRAMLRHYEAACTAASGLVDADEIGGRLAVEFFWTAALRLLVQPYAAHPEFDPAWSVSAGVR